MANATHRPENAYSKSRKYAPLVKESTFQARVIQAAKVNGWRIDLTHTEDYSSYSRFYELLTRCFPRKGIRAVRDFLLKRRGHVFTFAYHTHDSRYSQPGFPDLVLVHPERCRVIFAELKRDGEYPTTEQRLWAAALKCVEDEYPDAVSYRLWKPKHWESIVEELGGIDPLSYL